MTNLPEKVTATWQAADNACEARRPLISTAANSRADDDGTGRYRFVLVSPVGEFYSIPQIGGTAAILGAIPLFGDLGRWLTRAERWNGKTWEIA